MLALYLLLAHCVGDYLVQTRWQAAGKFGWSEAAIALRARHCAGYAAAFAPIAFVYANSAGAVAFLIWLAALHFLTDAQRFLSTPGEWVLWRLDRVDTHAEWLRSSADTTGHTSDDLAPNPWPIMPMMIDQTLHLGQITLLAALLL